MSVEKAGEPLKRSYVAVVSAFVILTLFRRIQDSLEITRSVWKEYLSEFYKIPLFFLFVLPDQGIEPTTVSYVSV